MKTKVANVAHSVRQRLKTLAQKSGRNADYLYQRYAFERFYYRIGISPFATKFILKGASLFAIWLGPMFRVTQDTDLEARLALSHEEIAAAFKAIASMPVEEDDGVVFKMETLELLDIKKHDNYTGVRVKFVATLEQARILLQFDLGFGDSIYPSPERASYPTLLGGTPPLLHIYPYYSVVAEKLSAIILLGMANSRLKDYFDLWTLSKHFSFNLDTLRVALHRTFTRRQIPLPQTFPIGLQPVFYNDRGKIAQWKAFLKKVAPQTFPDTLEAAIQHLHCFLEPLLLESSLTHATWSPHTSQWHPACKD